ncbi:DUF2607 family protein [Vibrio parahaemolyticus]|uniref:DUF2607 family protein n=1 Tax=Vibrio parahaemolyticus TaxID=670 RepID=UPI00201682B0|nr:DUF2607 family protein [Vibrio parahaemolyticus]
MYHHQQKTLRYWYRTALFFSVALLIAWNFAVVLHQVDLTPDHHTHHHCQLFSGVQHGIAKVQPTLSTPTFTRAQHHHVFFASRVRRRSSWRCSCPSLFCLISKLFHTQNY